MFKKNKNIHLSEHSFYCFIVNAYLFPESFELFLGHVAAAVSVHGREEVVEGLDGDGPLPALVEAPVDLGRLLRRAAEVVDEHGAPLLRLHSAIACCIAHVVFNTLMAPV